MLYEIQIVHTVQTEKKSKEEKLNYLVKDVEFSAACDKAKIDFAERFPGEDSKITKASESKILAYLKDDAVTMGELRYYRCKVELITVLEDDKEKKDKEVYLVPADSNKSANDVCNGCIDTMQDYNIKDVQEDKITFIIE